MGGAGILGYRASASLGFHVCRAGRAMAVLLSAPFEPALSLVSYRLMSLLPSASLQSSRAPAPPREPSPPRRPGPRCLPGTMSCVPNGVVPLGLLLLVCGAQGFFLPNVTHLEELLSKYQQDTPHSRVRRAIPRSDKEEILMLHNKLRGQVQPPASNMEYMVSAALPRGGLGRTCSCLKGGGGGRLGVSWRESPPTPPPSFTPRQRS